MTQQIDALAEVFALLERLDGRVGNLERNAETMTAAQIITAGAGAFAPIEHDTAHDDRFALIEHDPAHDDRFALIDHDTAHDDRFSQLGHTHPNLVASGSYTGNGGSTARQMATGFAPKLVIVAGGTSTSTVEMFHTFTTIWATNNNNAANLSYTTGVHLHATDGFVVADGTAHANTNLKIYNWIAFG